MANQRKKGKKRVSFWLTEAEVGLLKGYADENCINMTDAFRTLVIGARVSDKQEKSNRKGTQK